MSGEIPDMDTYALKSAALADIAAPDLALPSARAPKSTVRASA